MHSQPFPSILSRTRKPATRPFVTENARGLDVIGGSLQSRGWDMQFRVLLAIMMTCCTSVDAQQIPTDLLACEPGCFEVLPSSFILDCREGFGRPFTIWVSAWGRNWFGPLRYEGPIEVSIQARQPSGYEPLPLLLQIRTDQGAGQCRSDEGVIYWQTFGSQSCVADSMWITFPPTHLLLPLGATYWVQMVGLIQAQPTRGSSPFWRCLQVRSSSGVSAGSWGQVKALYRDATR